MSSRSATWTLTCWTRVRIGLIGNRLTAAIAMEWWRWLTRRNRILNLTPLIVSSM
jgi:hypothetical protein